MYKQIQRVVLLAMLVASQSVNANHETGNSHGQPHRGNDYYAGWQTWLAAGVGFGGDELGRFLDAQGDVETVTTGKGGHIEGGMLFGIDPWSSLRLSAGLQVGGITRFNGDSSFDRYQFGLSALRTHGSHEFGAGLTLHTGISYSCNIDEICSGTVNFEPAIGYTLEYAMRISPYRFSRSTRKQGLRLGLRYTGIEYTPEVGNEILDGHSLAGFIGLVF